MIQVQLYGEHFESLRLGFCYYGGVVALESAPERFFAYKKWQSGESLSKTTKLILLDSLLQEVCIKTGLTCRSPLSSLRMSVSLCQSQTFFIQD